MPVRRVKQPTENRLYDFDFASLSPGVTLSSATSVTQSTLDGSGTVTIGSPTVSGSLLQVRISGGTDGETYKLTATAVDSNSNTLVMEGVLVVRDL